MKLVVIPSSFLLLQLTANIFASVNGAVTFYDDKDAFMAALESSGATTRTSVACTPYEMDNKYLPFTQDDLTVTQTPGSPDNNFMQIYDSDPNFDNLPVYQILTLDIQNNNGNKIIDVSHPFTAMGFEAANAAREDYFGMNIFDGYQGEYHANDANANQGSKFYGWITDGASATQFTIGGGPSSQQPGKRFDFRITNFIYAVTDGSEATDYGYDCDNYTPTYVPRVCTASAWGDPHLVTFDGFKFDAQPKGEAIFLKSTDSTFEIQGRFESAGPFKGNPAVTTGVAIRSDDSTNQPDIQVGMATIEGAPDTVQVVRQPNLFCPVELYVDGVKEASISYGTGAGNDDGGPTVEVIGSAVIVEYPGLLRVVLRVFVFGRCFFSVDFELLDCESHANSAIGLLGSPNGDHNDDWMTRDGDVLPIPAGASNYFFQPAFDYTKDNWILTDESESLFYYETNKTFSDFAEPSQVYDPELEDLINNPDPEVSERCGGDIGCLIDGLTLGKEAADEYLANPASERVPEGPTESPTASPTGDDIEECRRRRQRVLETMEEKWNIDEPTFDFSRLNFTLDFGISDSISDQQVRATLYDNTCTVPYNGTGLIKSDNVTLVDNSGLPGDGFQNAPVIVTIDSTTISQDSQVYDENVPPGGQVTAVVDFCMRLSLYTPPAAGEDIEVNFLEVIVTLDVDLTDGFEIGNITVAPFDICEFEANEAFEVEGYFCEDGYENFPQTNLPLLNQGSVVKVCVRPKQRARDLSIRMRDIRNFTFYGGQDGVSQIAILNHEVARNGLTEMWCEPGYAVCHFETILFASFFVGPGNVTGSGFADLQFGGFASDSVTPRTRRRHLRSLEEEDSRLDSTREEEQRRLQDDEDEEQSDEQEGPGGSFDMEFLVQKGIYAHSGSTKTEPKAIFASWIAVPFLMATMLFLP